MFRKKSVFAITIMLVSSLFLFASCKDHSTKGAFMMDYFSEALDLSAEQQDELSTIRQEIVDKLEEMQDDKKAMYITMKEQLAGETIDKDVVRQLVVDHRSKMDEVIDLTVDRFATFHESLSTEQKDKLIAKLEKFKQYRNNRFHH